MKYKIIYNGLLYIEVEADNEDERKEAIKGIMYSIDTFSKNIDEEGHYIPRQEKPISVNTKARPESIQTAQKRHIIDTANINDQPIEERATDGQIRLMLKWKIEFPNDCTKREACALIHQYKRDHGMDDK